MKKYFLPKQDSISTSDVAKIVNDFLMCEYPILKKRYDYYNGKQAITRRVPSDDGKPCNKVVSNFCKNIVDTYEGYSIGVPVTYESENEGFEALMDCYNYNDVVSEDAALLKDSLIFGRAFEICYIDEFNQQRFKNLSPLTMIPVYTDDLNEELQFVIRFWSIDNTALDQSKYYCEVYDKYEVTTYSASSGFSSFIYIDKRPHFHNQVPITVFELNSENNGIFEPILSLQDAYNALLSDSIDDFDSFCDAYMVIKGMTADEDDIKSMKEHRVLLMDNDADASYLTKDVSTQEVQNLLTTCESKIREISACPNFSSETFGTSSGIAIRYRMMAMENQVAGIMTNFKKALQKRVELLAEIIRMVNGETLWRDIDIKFHRNIPVDLTSIATEVNQFRGLVSDETLLGQIPFVNDVAEEMARVKAENENKTSLYQNERLNGEI